MAFSLFGKRGTDSEAEKENESAGESSTSEALTEKRGFFDRMKKAVTRTRDSFTESIGSVLALTREIDETSLAELEKRLLKIELKQVLDGVATVDAVPAAPPEVVMMVGVNGTGKTTTTGKLAAYYRGQDRTVLLCAAGTFRAAAHQDGPDEGVGQDAANGGATGSRRAAPDAAGDGCDDRAERIAAGEAVHRGGAGDGDRADQAGWDRQGRDRAGDCDRVRAASEVCGRGREDGRHPAVRQRGVCGVDAALGTGY